MQLLCCNSNQSLLYRFDNEAYSNYIEILN